MRYSDRNEGPDSGPNPLRALLGAGLIGAGMARWSLGGMLLGGLGAWLLAETFCPRSSNDRRDERTARRPDAVDEASDESFPASDPPSFASGRAGGTGNSRTG